MKDANGSILVYCWGCCVKDEGRVPTLVRNFFALPSLKSFSHLQLAAPLADWPVPTISKVYMNLLHFPLPYSYITQPST